MADEATTTAHAPMTVADANGLSAPHLDANGTCDCMCPGCTVRLGPGMWRCVCPDCDVEVCGGHGERGFDGD